MKYIWRQVPDMFVTQAKNLTSGIDRTHVTATNGPIYVSFTFEEGFLRIKFFSIWTNLGTSLWKNYAFKSHKVNGIMKIWILPEIDFFLVTIVDFLKWL